MKIWNQHGSEHSANLVMIGHFENASEAAKAKEIIVAISRQVADDENKAKEIIAAISRQVEEDENAGRLVVGTPAERFGNEMLALLGPLNGASIRTQELEQFVYIDNVAVEGEKVVVTTDEIDVSALLKVMLCCGARIEVYSAP